MNSTAWTVLVEKFDRIFWSKILIENLIEKYDRNFWSKILIENFDRKFWSKILIENFDRKCGRNRFLSEFVWPKFVSKNDSCGDISTLQKSEGMKLFSVVHYNVINKIFLMLPLINYCIVLYKINLNLTVFFSTKNWYFTTSKWHNKYHFWVLT